MLNLQFGATPIVILFSICRTSIDFTLHGATNAVTLCSVGQLTTVLSELSRVLKPSGRLMFLEHVNSDNIWVANWQRRLNPIQKRVGCGCHLDRAIEQAMQGAGFRIDVLKRLQGGRHAPGTRFMPLIVGEAMH